MGRRHKHHRHHRSSSKKHLPKTCTELVPKSHFSVEVFFEILSYLIDSIEEVKKIEALCRTIYNFSNKHDEFNLWRMYCLQRGFAPNFEGVKLRGNLNPWKFFAFSIDNEAATIQYIKEDIDLKLIVMGEKGVGTRATTRTFTHGYYNEHYDPSFSASFKKTVDFQSFKVNVEIMEDMPYFDELIRESYTKSADGFVFICAANDLSSIQSLQKKVEYVQKVKNISLHEIPIVVSLNKVDMLKEATEFWNMLSKRDVEKYLEERGYYFSIYETSAKIKMGLEDMFRGAIMQVLRMRHRRDRCNLHMKGGEKRGCIIS